MSHYDSRSADPSSYRNRRSDSGFGGASGYGSSVRSSSSVRDYDVAEPPRKLDLDGLIPFEKNFYVESPLVAAMSEKEVEEYRLQREITVEGQDVPKPVKSFSDVGFPGTSC
ncbi:hypothetical protein Q3G72_034241 [Acer saccharum]|nr:hypothetical protein Q3G72_034241 [Acer saccharum]